MKKANKLIYWELGLAEKGFRGRIVFLSRRLVLRSSSHDLVDHLSKVEDPRIERSKIHSLIDILFIRVDRTIPGCDGPTDITSFAKTQMNRCRRFMELKNGVPSHDTLGGVVAATEAFSKSISQMDRRTGGVRRRIE